MADLQPFSFNSCPYDIQKLVISWLNLDLRSALRLQVTSKAFHKYIWETLSRFDCSLVAESVVQLLLDRVHPASLLSLDLSRSNEAIGSTELLNLRKKYPNLVNLAVKFTRDNMVNDHIKQLVEEQAGSLAELAFHNEAPDLELLKYRTLRIVLNSESGIASSMLNGEDRWTINYNLTSDTKHQAQAPIQIPEPVTCGSSLGEYTLIGTESGALYMYKDTKSPAGLVLERVVSNLHSERINSICITPAHDQIIVVSMDGFVTAWMIDSEEDGIKFLGLKTQIQFHEPIYHTFYHKSSEYYLAASKRMVYIHKGCIINSIGIRDDITGVYLTQEKKEYLISTEKNMYVLTGELKEVNYPLEYDTPSPNMALSPDESLIAIATKDNQLKLYDTASQALLLTFESCDCLQTTYNPRTYIVTYSDKGVICSLNLESKAISSMYTPRMSKKEIMAKKKLACKGIWYSTDGARFFALFSDDKLHCWLDKALYNQ